MDWKKPVAMVCITALGITHLYTIGDGTVLGLLMGALVSLAGVTIGQTSKEEK